MFKGALTVATTALLTVFLFGATGCEPPKPEPVKTVTIPDGEIDPAIWGKAYPEEYESWKKTEEPVKTRLSKYKTGMDGGAVSVDKLSEFPYMALLFNGWGFGVEYNEPRGHAYMIRDQLEIDASRLKSGGVCLSCKTPYAPGLQKKLGTDYYKLPFKQVLDMIPEKDRTLGVACIDCHDNKDMSLKISRGFTLVEGLKTMGADPATLTRQQMRTVVCAQCHVTYNIPKDKENKSVGLYFPWQGSTFGNITIENIIKQIRSDDSVREWKQTVTGFKMGFIRHPEFEFFTQNSVHYKAGASCADCHMPYTKAGVYKISDHRVMSPVQNEMRACIQCHAESTDWLKERVFTIQDRTASLMIRAGYATATVAKLFETIHKAKEAGKTINEEFYAKARDYYEEAFYRSLFMGAENSIGFHNPTEGLRILGDAVAFASKAEGLQRQLLAQAGVEAPLVIDLELLKYLEDRGDKKLKFNPAIEFKDPSGVQDRFK
ncbi:ammonia-forming cytochrome c nitrite reductase subunit c552 [Desulfovibrio sulfodismutans]|uniref:nitrite reductase (cytochrome; ammonia-forming) n=1 Tax=Desulfolutivibrio sulfodismutans TaxID=63561 RepID=A0A7K3NLY8_9BACT|nr:ammonia-forming cytochrome c nitrite reductase subunit c552 [Desulfolutivibrio sulfodismutans]NDY57212.1 ammonia-forming cytochrome c nitrite reductase subunit c552 [Desulfolutivibrio sulfodismutans]QLA13846.1 ammonia-forming cytochrome c nitrite reductase subunit c552 [Desulfolutivibrio sulfodismutans DSM 3696]